MPSDVEPPDPEAVTTAPDAARARVDLDCDVCGAPLRWAPEARSLACDHCGARRTVLARDTLIVERPLEPSAIAEASTGFGLQLRVLACETCGARTALEPHAVADSCPFCGSARVLDQGALRNRIRPESLVPLEVCQAQVEAAFTKWVRSRWFRPNALSRQREFRAVGLYVPAWTFDARAHSRWTAQSGTYYWETVHVNVHVNGRSERRAQQVRKVRWRPADGQRDDAFDDLLVLASKGVDGDLARRLGGFQGGGLVPYQPEYLAGWRAEEYQIDLEAGWAVARQEMEATQRARCASDVPGDTHRALRVETKLFDVRWKHVLLPIWSLTYTFRGAPYAVLVHGQTGRIVGRAPYSWVKILLLVLLIAGVIALVAASQ
ncbi:MAG: zinc ribbon domain-containing protein [Planctomycetota bacterium]